MQNVSIQKASELSPPLKSAIEQLLGRPSDAAEEVSIVAVPPHQVPPSENRAAVARKLEAFLNRRAEKTRDYFRGCFPRPCSPCRAVRPR
jgi:hypothetical protein